MAAGARGPGSGVTQGLGVALGSIAEDFVERVWGFLSVKDGLRSRLRSQTSKEREEHTQQATDVSLTYHFLTPLTNMVVEKPEVLADGTMAPAPTLPPAAGEAVATANELPSDAEDGKPQKANRSPGGQTSSTTNTMGEVVSPTLGRAGSLKTPTLHPNRIKYSSLWIHNSNNGFQL